MFVVCYGDDHRVSLQAALRDAGLPCIPVALMPRPRMLADAIRVAGLGIQDYVFRYRDGTYFVPIGTYGAILNSPALDAVVARERHGATR